MLCDGAASGAGAAVPVRAPPSPVNSSSTPTPSDPAKGDQVGWQPATSVLSVLSTYVLPMMFSILGARIAVMRDVDAKLRNSELAPRDRMLMLISLPMGEIAGVAVGLFLSPSTVPSSEIPGLAGNLTLTASGLGFIVGFGADSFFSFLDWLKSKLFPEPGPVPVSTPARPTPAVAQPSPVA